MNNRVKILLKSLVGLALLLLLLRQVHVRDSLALVSETRPLPFLLAFCLVVVCNLLSVARWKIMLHAAGAHIGFWRLFLVNMLGIFFSTFLPGSVAGDLFKVFYISSPKDSARLLSATVVSRVLGMVAVFGTGLAIAPLADARLQGQPWWPVYIAMLVVGLACSLIPLIPGPDRLGMRVLVLLRCPDRLLRVATAMLEPIAEWRARPGSAAASMVLALLYQIAGPFMVLYCCTVALDASVAPADVAAIAVVASVAFALPISLNGIGLAEGVYVVLLGLLGVTPERAFLIALLFRLVFTTQALAGGLAYFVVKRKPVGVVPGS